MSGMSMQSVRFHDKHQGWDHRSQPSLAALGHETCDYIQHKNYVLKILQKKQVAETRPVIPATQSEILSFLRSYLCSPIINQIFTWHPHNINTLIWSYIITAILEEVPLLFTLLFLSIYSPHEHLYSSKMFPLVWGCSLQVIMASIAEMLYVSDMLTVFLDYALKGVFKREPWTRCEQNTYKILGQEINCYNTKSFIELTQLNETIVTGDYNYKLNGSLFQISHIIYYKLWRWDAEIVVIYNCILWLGAVLFYKEFFKTTLWRVIDCLNWLVFFVYLISWLYIKINLEPSFNQTHTRAPENTEHYNTLVQGTLLAITINSPPVIHLLGARCITKPEPGRDSIIFTLSRFLFECFQVVVHTGLKNACEIQTGIGMQMNAYNSYPLFFLWPMFFENFRFGPFYTKSLFILFFLWQYITFIITYHCLVEVVVTEWKKCKRWIVLIALTLIGLISKSIFTHEFIFFLYFFCKVITVYTEVAVIHWLYPIGRLLEDINFFYYGNTRSWMRTFSIKVMPYWCITTGMIIMMQFAQLYPMAVKKTTLVNWVWVLPVSPVVFGAIYITIQTVYVNKQKWTILITPKPEWGPKEHLVRQFRKQFDDRDFIDSQGPRFLNRHMLKRAEGHHYRLGVQYEPEKRRATSHDKHESPSHSMDKS